MDRYKLIAWFATVISICLLILPRLFPICTGRARVGGELLPMACHYAYQAEFIIGLLAVIAAVSLFVLRTFEAKTFASFLILLFGLVMIIIPQTWAIGICPEGACQKTTFFVILGSILYSLAGAVNIWLLRKTEQGEGT